MEETDIGASILNSIKKDLGIGPDYTHFDVDLILHINTALSILTQLGVGPSTGFSITGPEEEWSEFITETNLGMVKEYVSKKTKQLFEFSTMNGPTNEALNKILNELEWRINVAVDPGEKEE